MRELRDRWILPLDGRTVARCCIDDAFSIELSLAGCTEATIRIGGTFGFQSADGFWHPHPVGDTAALTPMLELLGLTVDRAEAYKDGTLNVAFSNGSRLRVAPDPDYEAWEFAADSGAKAVALPGGDIAIWRSAA